MASASSLLSEEQFLCSICLDIFTDPVSTPCGHNFCKVCISKHWESKGLSQCPLCNEKFPKRYELQVNTGFREVVENIKKINIIGRCEALVKPGEVPCDFCSGTKLKALKSCLVCLASYCETHLEPHQRVAALKRHKLIDPVENLEDRMCKKHDKMLELFCRTDQLCVCVMCTEHKTHDTVPLEEECEEKKTQLDKMMAEVQQMIQERQLQVQEINNSVQLNNKDTEEDIAKSVEVFTALVASIQRNQAELIEVMEEKQRAAEEQAEGFIEELEEEITELQRRSSELERFAHSEDHLRLLQSFQSFSSSPHTKKCYDIIVCRRLCVEAMKRAVAHIEKTLTKEMEQLVGEFRGDSKIINKDTDTVKKQMETISSLKNLPEDIKLKTIQQQYAVDLTFDPDFANFWLFFSEDMKQVQIGFFWWCHHDNPKRFDRYLYVLGDKGFSSGRFYYEVLVNEKTGWDLGVVRESVSRKRKLTPNPKNGIWIICLREENKYRALHDHPVPLSLSQRPEKVGVFVDYEEGLVSFYDVKAGTLIYSFTGCSFTEKIYPLFSPGPPEGGKNLAPLIITPVKNTWSKSFWKAVCYYFAPCVFAVIVMSLDWYQ